MRSRVITLVMKFVAGYDKVPSVTWWPSYLRRQMYNKELVFWKD